MLSRDSSDLRVPFHDLHAAVERALLKLGLEQTRANLSARLIAETDRDGVRTHGIARLPRFAEMVRLGRINPSATPDCVTNAGALERWRGNRGPGNLAAHAAMQRAMELAGEHGIGAVALGDTTHWLRGGTYGWQAAEAGFTGMCWSNTLPNLPPWGASTPAVGNNPLVMAVPSGSADRAPVVLDIAMSQFSYGTLQTYRERGESLPVFGGFDEAGALTTDPAAIEHTQRALPIGFWKGSSLAFVLDVFATMLSGGLGTHALSSDPLAEVGQSQMFIAFAPQSVAARAEMEQVVRSAADALHVAEPVEPGRPPHYPGEASCAAAAVNSAGVVFRYCASRGSAIHTGMLAPSIAESQNTLPARNSRRCCSFVSLNTKRSCLAE